MSQESYQSALRVFWIRDNCSAHRGQRAADRFRRPWPNAILIHTPNHASWLNQVDIYFSIVQRKVLTPNDFSYLADLEQRLLAFQIQYERTASPFKMVLHAQRPAGAPRQTQRQTFGSSRLAENMSP
jgi:hypothetical protein